MSSCLMPLPFSLFCAFIYFLPPLPFFFLLSIYVFLSSAPSPFPPPFSISSAFIHYFLSSYFIMFPVSSIILLPPPTDLSVISLSTRSYLPTASFPRPLISIDIFASLLSSPVLHFLSGSICIIFAADLNSLPLSVITPSPLLITSFAKSLLIQLSSSFPPSHFSQLFSFLSYSLLSLLIFPYLSLLFLPSSLVSSLRLPLPSSSIASPLFPTSSLLISLQPSSYSYSFSTVQVSTPTPNPRFWPSCFSHTPSNT